MTQAKGEWLGAVLACSMLALLLCDVSNNLHARVATRDDAIQQQFALLEGRPLPFGGHTAPMKMWRNRILFPWLLEAANRTSLMTLTQAYAVVRFATAVVALLAFWWVVRRAPGASADRALLGCGLLTYMLLFTILSFGLDIPSDFPDAALAAMTLWAVITTKRGWIIVFAAIAATNRESAAFAGLLWLCVHGVSDARRAKLGEWAFAAALSSGAYALVTALRALFGSQYAETAQVFAFASIKFWLTGFLRHPGLNGWPLLAIAMWGLPLIVLWPRRRDLDSNQTRLLAGAGVIALVSAVFGSINELRVFIPSIVIVAYVTSTIRPTAASASGRDRLQTA